MDSILYVYVCVCVHACTCMYILSCQVSAVVQQNHNKIKWILLRLQIDVTKYHKSSDN